MKLPHEMQVLDTAARDRDGKRRQGRLLPASRCLITLAGLLIATSLAFGQISVTTQHYDNARTGQNTNEALLTHANVNSGHFGKLFTQNLDGQMPAQPLYVPNILIPATNTIHNVVYVATQHDSVYAFDADNNQGANAGPLWQVNFLNSSLGITTIPVGDVGCSVGFTEFGIESTPVIDLTRNAIYVLAMTKENGVYVHRLHALDLGTGNELFGGPVQISASVTINGKTYTFADKYQMQRPGLLLQNGTVYIGFGSPGCNTADMGWVMAYDAGTLQQVGVFDDSPGVDDSAVWMSGAGLAGDNNGNVFFSSGDGLFDADIGGDHFGDSVMKLNQSSQGLSLTDYFTPWNQQFLQENNLDVGSGQVTLLPDEGTGNLALAVGKAGVLYLLDQNNMGQYNPIGDSQIVQEVVAPVTGGVHAGLTYWNNTVFLEAEQTPILAYSYTNGQLSANPIYQSSLTFISRGGIVSSNGSTDAIFWSVTPFTRKLFAFDATNLNELYNNTQAGTRDALGNGVHFGMPVVANGKLYVDGATQLAVFGLLPFFSATAGNNQSGAMGTTLPIALQVTLTDAYNGNPVSGVTVTFKDGGKGGTFSNPNPVTDSSGVASTTYTLPPKVGTYTITASNSNYVTATFTETAISTATTTTVTTSGSPSFINQPVTFTATISSPYGPIPDGETVTFYDGSTSIGTGLTAGGAATFSTSTLTVKSHTIKASYPGDATFKASSGTVTQVVNLYPSATSQPSSSLNPSTYGQSVTLNTTVTSTAPSGPTGTVNFNNGATSLGTATLNASGVATLTKTNIPAGSDSITAVYNGDSETAKSTSPVLVQTVNQAVTSTALTSSPNPSNSGQTVTFTAKVTSPTTVPTGTVTFMDGTTTLATVNLTSGKASYSTSSLSSGSHSITAVYNGTPNILGSTSPILVQVVN